MNMNTISGVLDQIQYQARQVSGTSFLDSFTQRTKNQETPQFSDVLFNSINGISQMQTQAKSQAENYLSGAPGIGLNDVMVSLQKSSLSLNLGVQTRNKLVSAYQDIMSMTV